MGIGQTNPGAKLEVNGQIKITGGTPAVNEVLTTVDGSGLATWEAVPAAQGVPSGLVAMWYGTIASIPSGWLFCDGLSFLSLTSLDYTPFGLVFEESGLSHLGTMPKEGQT